MLTASLVAERIKTYEIRTFRENFRCMELQPNAQASSQDKNLVKSSTKLLKSRYSASPLVR